MLKYVAAAALGLAWLAAGPAAAQTPPKPQIPVVADDVQVMETWLAESAAWSQLHIALAQEAVQVVGQTMAAARQAADGFSDSAVATSWVTRQRATLDSINARFARISPTPPPVPAAMPEVAHADADAVRATALEGYEASRTLLNALSGKLEPMFVTIVSATRGDANARARVEQDAIELSILLIELENSTLLSSRLEKGHPQRDVQDASIESNRAIIAMLAYQLDVAAKRPADERAAAALIRSHAQLARDAAEALVGDVGDWQAEFAGGTGDMSFDSRIGQVIALYIASVDVERRMADALDVVAARVEAGDVEGAGVAFAPVAQLIQQRLSLDMSRRQAIAAQ